MTTDFLGFNLPQPVLLSLARLELTIPTPIQVQAIPVALEGHDVLGTAQTGTGKTAAFGIPLVTRLLEEQQGGALVMAPTRELAAQVMDQLRAFLGPRSPVKTALLIGGESMGKQLGQLRMRPRLIVGTPGRINDHLGRGSLDLGATDFLVLDETDRMLDMGFGIQIDRILAYLPEDRQTLMFSATLPPNILKMSERYLRSPKRIAVGSTTTAPINIKQEMIRTEETAKYPKLLSLLQEREGSVIIFVKTKHGADRLARNLTRENHLADAIHGNLRQSQRDRVIQGFRDRQYRIMVATDVAARGLDIPHIAHVINYDLPQCPEDYLHRIGRTARAGAEGSAICLVTPTDQAKWRAIQKLMNPEAVHAEPASHWRKRPEPTGAAAGRRSPRRRAPAAATGS